MWLAPNLITIIGLAINVLTSLIHLYFCPTAKEEVSISKVFAVLTDDNEMNDYRFLLGCHYCVHWDFSFIRP